MAAYTASILALISAPCGKELEPGPCPLPTHMVRKSSLCPCLTLPCPILWMSSLNGVASGTFVKNVVFN